MRPVKLDLYNEYVKRVGAMAKGPDEFRVLFRILLACDATHDFLGSRNKENSAFKDKCKKAIKTQLEDDLKNYKTTFAKLKPVLKNKTSRKISYDNWFNSDDATKSIVDAIMNYLNFENILASTYTKGDCSTDKSITRTLDVMARLLDDRTSSFKVTPRFFVDMSTATSNLLPILSSVLNYKINKQYNCPSPSINVKLVNDIASKYDPANVETIFTVFKNNDLLIDTYEKTSFEISLFGEVIIVCELDPYLNSYGIRKIKLNVFKFFNISSPVPFGENNDKNTVIQNNSVRGLIENIKPLTDYKEIYKIMISKTLGDFLQIMTFKNDNIIILGKVRDTTPVFITGDHICNCIASLFSRYVIGETLNTLNPVVDSLGVYVQRGSEKVLSEIPSTLVDVNRREFERRDAAETLADFAKRTRTTEFGKKDSVSNLSNKTLKERLKSVGIKITKTVQGKRKELSRIQLESLARKFKKLQMKAKNKGIKLKTKKGNYKSEVTLVKEIEKIKTKSRFGS